MNIRETITNLSQLVQEATNFGDSELVAKLRDIMKSCVLNNTLDTEALSVCEESLNYYRALANPEFRWKTILESTLSKTSNKSFRKYWERIGKGENIPTQEYFKSFSSLITHLLIEEGQMLTDSTSCQIHEYMVILARAYETGNAGEIKSIIEGFYRK